MFFRNQSLISSAIWPGPSPDTPQPDSGIRVAGRVLRKTSITFEVARSPPELRVRSSSALSTASSG